MSAAAGSSPPPPPGGNGRGSKPNSPYATPTKKPLKSASSSKPSSPSTPATRANGNGSTRELAAWSSGIWANPTVAPQYVVDGLGLGPRWRRVTLPEAHQYATSGYTILNGTTFEVVPRENLPAAATINPAQPNTPAYGGLGSVGQTIVAAETALSVAGDPQYLATQQVHEQGTGSDAGDNEGRHSSEEEDSSSSSSSGERSNSS